VSDAAKLAYTVKEACELTGLGTTTIYKLFNAGRLRKVKVGTRTLIPRASLEALLVSDGHEGATDD
jgi:excisionase family DNA binding protein